MSSIIKQVYEVFGDEFPSRSHYGACTSKPFPVLTITKEFKTWAKFKVAYLEYSVSLRKAKVEKKVVTETVTKKQK